MNDFSRRKTNCFILKCYLLLLVNNVLTNLGPVHFHLLLNGIKTSVSYTNNFKLFLNNALFKKLSNY